MDSDEVYDFSRSMREMRIMLEFIDESKMPSIGLYSKSERCFRSIEKIADKYGYKVHFYPHYRKKEID